MLWLSGMIVEPIKTTIYCNDNVGIHCNIKCVFLRALNLLPWPAEEQPAAAERQSRH